MADSDVQILATGSQAAPLDYVIKDTVVLQPKMVQALFTDNGAAGDWLPAVVLISDSGHVLGRATDQGVKVTAGSDASVSWFPGVKHAAAVSSLPSCTLEVNNATGNIAAGTLNYNFSAIHTNDASVFSIDGGDSTIFDLGTVGFYMLSAHQGFSSVQSTLTEARLHATGDISSAWTGDLAQWISDGVEAQTFAFLYGATFINVQSLPSGGRVQLILGSNATNGNGAGVTITRLSTAAL